MTINFIVEEKKAIEQSPAIIVPAIQGLKIINKHGRFWLRQVPALIGVTDFRARTGNYSTPFNTKSNPLFKMPELKHINESLEDLLDQRALEIYKNALASKKEIAVLWSGGIDSTMILVSFLKNIPKEDIKILNVVFDTNSILENTEFYKKYISNKLNAIHFRTADLNEKFLKKYILLHGDPADCLFGPSTPIYNYFLQKQQHLQPWKTHLKKIKELLDARENNDNELGFGDWWANKVIDNLEESGHADYISTIADFWWWSYFNFRWEFSCQRPFMFMRRDFTTSFNDDTMFDYAKNTFLNTDKFQRWSYSNIKKLIPSNADDVDKLHKIEAKKYIFNFTKDNNYLNYKRKTTARQGNLELQKSMSPIYYNKNYSGVFKTQTTLTTIKILLEQYRG